MKGNLEYKILKYLSEKDNGEPIEVSNLSVDKQLLKTKLKSLLKEQFISCRVFNDVNITAKIKFKGNECLNKMESENKIITNNFNNSTIGQFNQESDFFESPNKIKTNDAPSNKTEIKSSLQKFFSNPWVLLISGIAIEEVTLGKIYKFIIDIF